MLVKNEPKISKRFFLLRIWAASSVQFSSPWKLCEITPHGYNEMKNRSEVISKSYNVLSFLNLFFYAPLFLVLLTSWFYFLTFSRNDLEVVIKVWSSFAFFYRAMYFIWKTLNIISLTELLASELFLDFSIIAPSFRSKSNFIFILVSVLLNDTLSLCFLLWLWYQMYPVLVKIPHFTNHR